MTNNQKRQVKQFCVNPKKFSSRTGDNCSKLRLSQWAHIKLMFVFFPNYFYPIIQLSELDNPRLIC